MYTCWSSRAFLPEEASDLLPDQFEINIVHTLPISEAKLERIKQETLKDPSLQELKHTVEKGWPNYPQLNGMAEKAVQTAKSLIKKAMHDKDIYLALVEYRNTPLNDKLGSPVQRLMGMTKTLIPTTEQLLKPKIIKPEIVHQEITKNKKRKKYY